MLSHGLMRRLGLDHTLIEGVTPHLNRACAWLHLVWALILIMPSSSLGFIHLCLEPSSTWTYSLNSFEPGRKYFPNPCVCQSLLAPFGLGSCKETILYYRWVPHDATFFGQNERRPNISVLNHHLPMTFNFLYATRSSMIEFLCPIEQLSLH
jgi:hypothetical protein